jgi:hypothetical protein
VAAGESGDSHITTRIDPAHGARGSPPPQLHRITTSESIRVALRAGSQKASTVTIICTRAIATNAAGSVALTPNSDWQVSRKRAEAAARRCDEDSHGQRDFIRVQDSVPVSMSIR